MSEHFAVVVPQQGDSTVIEWDPKRLDPAYAAIGCTTVELLDVHHLKLHLWIDEDARCLANVPTMNPRASLLSGVHILGIVVVTPLTNEPDAPGFDRAEAHAFASAMNVLLLR